MNPVPQMSNYQAESCIRAQEPLGKRERTQMHILMPCLPRQGWHSSRHRLHTSLGSAGREGASVIPRMWPGVKFASSSREAWLLQASP